jgi:acyl-CoA thioester hydrolase/thioesterase-3
MYSTFESEIKIRPDDIDLNNHVHNTKYFDYVQAARYEQMKLFYKMPMEEFFSLGYNWFVSSAYIEYKRSLKLEDEIKVRTKVEEINGAQCKVDFWIILKITDKIAAQGYLLYTMISIKSGKPIRIPQSIIERYSI